MENLREELIDVIDIFMRLGDRADAERIADALIDRPDLLAAVATSTTLRKLLNCTDLLRLKSRTGQ